MSANVSLTLGARIERNDYTGYEFLPSARLAWKLAPDHLLWTAASRTVRAPSRIDRDFFFPPNPAFVIAGGPQFRSEMADVYELGYRGQPSPRISYSLTVFHNEYDYLRTLELARSGTSSFSPTEWKTDIRRGDVGFDAGDAGVETERRIHRAQRTASAQARQHGDQRLSAEGNDPANTWIVRSTLDLPRNWELDVIARHAAALPDPVVQVTPRWICGWAGSRIGTSSSRSRGAIVRQRSCGVRQRCNTY